MSEHKAAAAEQVGAGEADVLGKCEQQQVKNAQREREQTVLDGMQRPAQ